MKARLLLPFLLMALILVGCKPATPPPPITIPVGAEFSLAPGQSATLEGAGLTIQLISVGSDERCPSGIECAVSGPVTMTISVQKGSSQTPTQIVLQSFTDNDGRAPEMEFEGIQDRVTFGGFQIKAAGVLPYPVKQKNEIKASDYRVSFVVTK